MTFYSFIDAKFDGRGRMRGGGAERETALWVSLALLIQIRFALWNRKFVFTWIINSSTSLSFCHLYNERLLLLMLMAIPPPRVELSWVPLKSELALRLRSDWSSSSFWIWIIGFARCKNVSLMASKLRGRQKTKLFFFHNRNGNFSWEEGQLKNIFVLVGRG